MEYGLIGEKLPHSFSKAIHSLIGEYDYTLRELAPGEVDAFMRKADFKAINVTIPYKQTVLPYLDEISAEAAEIGAVNTIVKKGGKLYGYNTDIGGLRALIKRVGGISGKKVLILGTGGTSKTALAAARAEGASSVLRVSRSGRDGAVSYEEAVNSHSDAEVLINTTPCGMFPNTEGMPIDPAAFPRLAASVDAVYNPLRTRLVLSSREAGAAAEGGLYMLVKQASLASELFFGTAYSPDPTDGIYRKILSEKENIVLSGMPGSGKSTVGALLAAALGRPFYDTDALLVQRHGEIAEIFKRHGEAHFRSLETEVIKELAPKSGCVIATGGGAVLRAENVKALKQNGRVYFLDRPLSALLPTADRPLASTAEDIKRRYEERYGIYTATADVKTEVEGDAESAAREIERRHFS